ncbi:MAG TPA: NYN domain-containing protein [Bacteroidia bacterium]|jgi:hypothetical protein|nr:NYN domain-containing protein [Bacteroidia bacterium]
MQRQALERGLYFFMTSTTQESKATVEPKKQRVIFYIDGYNFYYGLRENGWRKFYWLDVVSFCEKFLSDNQELVCVKYFSAAALHLGKNSRQEKLFSVNKNNPKFKLILGSYLNKDVNCSNCNTTFPVPEEKKTDVNIATNLIMDCVYDNCDISVLISGDSDLTPPLEFIKTHNSKHSINVFFPPKRVGHHLKLYANSTISLEQYKSKFQKSIFNDRVELGNGKFVLKPQKWN